MDDGNPKQAISTADFTFFDSGFQLFQFSLPSFGFDCLWSIQSHVCHYRLGSGSIEVELINDCYQLDLLKILFFESVADMFH